VKDLALAFEGKEKSSHSNLGELVPAESQVYSRHTELRSLWASAPSHLASVPAFDSDTASYRIHGYG